MVNLKIDNVEVSVKEGSTIMEAAAAAGINIPHLCYWKGLNEIAACRVCVVEIEGKEKLITACNNAAEEGMVVYTNSPKVRLDRRRTVQLILSEHDCLCATCVRSGNCSLQKIANDLNIHDAIYDKQLEEQPWDKHFPLIRDSKKCIKCMRCVQVCDKIQSLNIWDLEGTGSRSTINVTCNRSISEADCSLCGQCITHCPVGALRERDDTEKLWKAIADPNKVVVVQVAPAVRAAFGESLGLSREQATVGKIFDALKRMGVDYVFDTTFSADLTIMEEANEFIQRFTGGELKDRPMFTSCCPGWIRFIKSQFPELVPQLSSAKSPMQMFGAVMKTYFAEQIGKKPEDIYSVAIMPCLAKKGEANMPLYYGEYAGHDTDLVITTRELCRMIRSTNILPQLLRDVEADRLFRDGSGAGVIFGATGGVMEAALRTAYFKIMGENCTPDAFRVVRAAGDNFGVQEAEFRLKDIKLRVAAVSGLANTRKLLTAIERGEKHYDFVEVMACPGGCVGGGGQPQHDGYELAYERGQNLYFLDNRAEIRYSHMNPDIWNLYNNFFGEPLSHKAHQLLHTDHNAWEMPRSPKRNRNGYVINPNVKLQG
ncbi:MAG TPA: (2Fe-2S)-binding protein [Candidatus Avilachnospira avistercoris]|nr:(2Fe-2S)-binding protein [Candidatus Avilachnospira avistercoris]